MSDAIAEGDTVEFYGLLNKEKIRAKVLQITYPKAGKALKLRSDSGIVYYRHHSYCRKVEE